MKIRKFAVIFLTSATALVTLAGALSAPPLTDQDKQFLKAYERVHQALVADDLGSAQKAAADLGSSGVDLTRSKSLPDARTSFAKLSDEAKQLTADQPGYYVIHCPMLKRDWVQTSEKVANPYGGPGMINCGETKK